MLIDWFTVGAQALNFLILVWLMKRFLYKPVLDAVDAREKRIAAELADANAKKAEAKKDRDEFKHKNEAFDQQRASLLETATQAANAERKRLIDDARKAADALSATRQEALRKDAEGLRQAIRLLTEKEVFAIARKALSDLATTTLEERMCDVFIRRLQAMDGPAREALANTFNTATNPALVRSAFDLPAAQRAAIQLALKETFATDREVHFETAPDLVSGIELSANGQKVAWSIADYLASMEKGVDELLAEKTKPTADAPATKVADGKVPDDVAAKVGDAKVPDAGATKVGDAKVPDAGATKVDDSKVPDAATAKVADAKVPNSNVPAASVASTAEVNVESLPAEPLDKAAAG